MQESWECIFNMTTQLNYYRKNASRNLKNKKPRGFISRKTINIILFKKLCQTKSLQVKVLRRVWTGRIHFLKVQLKPTGGCKCSTSHTHGCKRTQLCILCVHLETKHTYNVQLYRLYNLHSWVSFQPQILPFARKQTFTLYKTLT